MRILSSGREGNIYDTRKINDMLYVSEKYVNAAIKAKLGIVRVDFRENEDRSRPLAKRVGRNNSLVRYWTEAESSIIGINFYHDNYSN